MSGGENNEVACVANPVGKGKDTGGGGRKRKKGEKK